MDANNNIIEDDKIAPPSMQISIGKFVDGCKEPDSPNEKVVGFLTGYISRKPGVDEKGNPTNDSGHYVSVTMGRKEGDKNFYLSDDLCPGRPIKLGERYHRNGGWPPPYILFYTIRTTEASKKWPSKSDGIARSDNTDATLPFRLPFYPELSNEDIEEADNIRMHNVPEFGSSAISGRESRSAAPIFEFKSTSCDSAPFLNYNFRTQ